MCQDRELLSPLQLLIVLVVIFFHHLHQILIHKVGPLAIESVEIFIKNSGDLQHLVFQSLALVLVEDTLELPHELIPGVKKQALGLICIFGLSFHKSVFDIGQQIIKLRQLLLFQFVFLGLLFLRHSFWAVLGRLKNARGLLHLALEVSETG